MFQENEWVTRALNDLLEVAPQNYSYVVLGSTALMSYTANKGYERPIKDIDIIGVAQGKKLAKISDKILKAQETQTKKIHSINLTQKEFKQELKRPNKAYVEAVKKGVILFGQENFIKFIRGLQKW